MIDNADFGSAREFCRYFFDGYLDVVIRDKSYFGILVCTITEIICKTLKGSTKLKSTVRVLRRGLVRTVSTLRDNSSEINGAHDDVEFFRSKVAEEDDLVEYAERVLVV
ncbi:hypothetical protein P3T76_008113 [Phytophthora citrophthora]|uniref:Uncharacterized protein n=1 Tax=Phytophthora citrophthora TaxID=4793 RepID=A0AAD9GLI1_9STRA|nr:hypothetical protein P3T76_008113 [Phytophthora citrophthora]